MSLPIPMSMLNFQMALGKLCSYTIYLSMSILERKTLILNILECTNKDMKILQYIQLYIKNSTTQITHYSTFHFLRYVQLKYGKSLFTNLQKQ